MGKNDKKDSKEKIDTLKVDDYFKDAPTDEEPETEGWNENDQKAADLLEQAFRVWTVVETDEENEIEYRKPTKKKQIEKSQKLIDEARDLNPTDEWIVNRIVELQEVVDSGKQKVFDGSYKLMIASVILSFFIFIMPGLKSCSYAGDITMQSAMNLRQSRIKNYTSYIKKFTDDKVLMEKGVEANPSLTKPQIKERIKGDKKKIKYFTKELEKHENMTDKKMLKVMKSNARKSGWGKFWRGIFYLICVVLYYFVCFTPQFVFDKRKTEQKILAVGGNIVKSIWNGISNFMINQPGSFTTRYKYSDGHTEDETAINPFPIIGIALKIGGPILWYIFNMLFLPVIVIVKYVRNHKLYI